MALSLSHDNLFAGDGNYFAQKVWRRLWNVTQFLVKLGPEQYQNKRLYSANKDPLGFWHFLHLDY